MNIAIIPARGGSKRIPRKNIRNFAGHPLISWSILAAKNSGLFDKTIVSTDDPEIAFIAEKYGAEVPFVRPPELSDDFAGTTEVISHATRWLIEQKLDISSVCCIYSTAPFVQKVDLVKGLKLLQSGNWSYSFSATDFPATIFRSFGLNEDGSVKMFFPEHFKTRSQDLPTAFHDAGQFYWGTPNAWLEKEKIFSANSIAIVIPRWRVQDIDIEDDWIRAELIFKQMENLKNE